ncbi:MAG: hypothetical protein JXJ20_15100 [Anaerolineae bacterium]|nr:hypothetical protein [Anaerolineae bacterium]
MLATDPVDDLTILARRSARDLIPGRYYPLFLTLVFLTSLAIAYLFVPVINHDDWVRTAQNLRYMWRGQDAYLDPWPDDFQIDQDLQAYDIPFWGSIGYSPWMMFYFGVLIYATARVVIALNVACWMVIILDSGRPAALILILHPAFIMLWASANIGFLVNGVGLWLICRDVRGWRRGTVLMLIAIKPQVMPLLLVLEGLRTLWERDWEAVLTMAGIFAVSVSLFPTWLFDTLPTYLSGIGGGGVTTSDRTLAGYSFSVFGAWGAGAALAVTAFILLCMRRRLTEWRTLAVLLGFAWTPYVNLYSFAVLLILFRKAPAWRVLLYLVIGFGIGQYAFVEFHTRERIGTLVFLLAAAALTAPEPDQTEEAIAARRHEPIFPPVRALVRWRAQNRAVRDA